MFQYAGISLIEVLISFFILSLMFLGLDAAHFSALKATKSAYYYAVAEQQLHIIVNQLQVIKASDVDTVVEKWNGQNKIILPHARGSVTGAYPHYQASLCWERATCLNMSLEK